MILLGKASLFLAPLPHLGESPYSLVPQGNILAVWEPLLLFSMVNTEMNAKQCLLKGYWVSESYLGTGYGVSDSEWETAGVYWMLERRLALVVSKGTQTIISLSKSTVTDGPGSFISIGFAHWSQGEASCTQESLASVVRSVTIVEIMVLLFRTLSHTPAMCVIIERGGHFLGMILESFVQKNLCM